MIGSLLLRLAVVGCAVAQDDSAAPTIQLPFEEAAKAALQSNDPDALRELCGRVRRCPRMASTVGASIGVDLVEVCEPPRYAKLLFDDSDLTLVREDDVASFAVNEVVALVRWKDEDWSGADHPGWLWRVLPDSLALQTQVEAPGCEGLCTGDALIQDGGWLTDEQAEHWLGEPFVAECSGVLLDERHVLTAAHCMEEPEHLRVVRNLAGKRRQLGTRPPMVAGGPLIPMLRVREDDVRSFTRLPVAELPDGLDLALLRLDEAFPEARGVALGTLEVGSTEVFAVGHPLGGWMRSANAGLVVPDGEQDEKHLAARISGLPGSSGGPVLACEDESLVGIIVSGPWSYQSGLGGGCCQLRWGEADDAHDIVDLRPLVTILDRARATP